MRWQKRRRSRHVEDHRHQRPPRTSMSGGPLLRLLPLLLSGRKSRKWVLMMAAGLLAAHFLGFDIGRLLSGGALTASRPGIQETRLASAEQEALADFVQFVLASTEDVWHPLFRQMGKVYREPTLRLFTGSTTTACGKGQAAMGPFYCPADQKIYIDLSFYEALKHQHGAPGDFAQAYVIAHEVGHHIQTLLGVSQQVHQQKSRSNAVGKNKLSVLQELQADCLAGIWAHQEAQLYQSLEPGDIEEALQAAAAIGDDTLQRQAQGYAVPDSFTHGSSKERVHWFLQGYQKGNMTACNTFKS